jgi:hypothetical protein
MQGWQAMCDGCKSAQGISEGTLMGPLLLQQQKATPSAATAAHWNATGVHSSVGFDKVSTHCLKLQRTGADIHAIKLHIYR